MVSIIFLLVKSRHWNGNIKSIILKINMIFKLPSFNRLGVVVAMFCILCSAAVLRIQFPKHHKVMHREGIQPLMGMWNVYYLQVVVTLVIMLKSQSLYHGLGTCF